HDNLFRPSYQNEIHSLQQPLLVAPGSHLRPYYLAEFLTVVEGGRGQLAETEKLLEKNKSASMQQIINDGSQLVKNAVGSVEHLVGKSSMAVSIVPAPYFYTESGRYG